MKLKISIRRVREKEWLPQRFTGQIRWGCPSCGAKVYTEDRYCHHCGQPFAEDQKVDEVVYVIQKEITHK